MPSYLTQTVGTSFQHARRSSVCGIMPHAQASLARSIPSAHSKPAHRSTHSLPLAHSHHRHASCPGGSEPGRTGNRAAVQGRSFNAGVYGTLFQSCWLRVEAREPAW